MSRKITLDSKLLQEKYNGGPLLDTRIYFMDFDNGNKGKYGINIRAEAVTKSA